MLPLQDKQNVGIYIGRFEPFHLGHWKTCQKALKECEGLILVLGSSTSTNAFKNPWSLEERIQMIQSCFTNEEKIKISFVGLEDVNDDVKWKNLLKEKLSLPSHIKVNLYGHHKDASSYYLDSFPEWNLVETGNFHSINSTDIRKMYFENDTVPFSLLPWPIAWNLNEFKKHKMFQERKKAYADFLKK